MLPFKAVIKPKSSKINNTDESIAQSEVNKNQEDDTEYVNLNETQDEKLKTNQYQQVGQEDSNTSVNQINKTDNDQEKEQESDEIQNLNKNKISSDESKIYKTLEQNPNLSENDYINSELHNDNSGQNNNELGLDSSTNQNITQADLAQDSSTNQNITQADTEKVNDGTESSYVNSNVKDAEKSNIRQETQYTYQPLQPSNSSDLNNSIQQAGESISGSSNDQIEYVEKQSESTQAQGVVKGDTFTSEFVSQGVTGETQVSPTDNFGVAGQTTVPDIQEIGVSGEKRVLDTSTEGVRGDTSTSLNTVQSNNSTNADLINDETNNIYRQIGPDGESVYEIAQDAEIDQSSSVNSSQQQAPFDNNRLTLDNVSATETFEASQNKASQDLGFGNDEKSIYASLPGTEISTEENPNTTDSTNKKDVDSNNSPPIQTSLVTGEFVTTSRNIEGASGDKTVQINEYSTANGDTRVTYRELPGSKGDTAVNLPDYKGVADTSESNTIKSQQNDSEKTIAADSTTKLIINKSSQGESKTQDSGISAEQISENNNTSSSNDSNEFGYGKTPYRNIDVSNVGQNPFVYEDIQSSQNRRTLPNQQEEDENTNLEQISQTKQIYKTITDDFGNTYQVDEYGNKINDSDASFDNLQFDTIQTQTGDSLSSPRYSTIDGVTINERNESEEYQSNIESSEFNQNAQNNLPVSNQNRSDETIINNQLNSNSQNNSSSNKVFSNQAQSVYTSLPGNKNNTARLTRTDSVDSNKNNTKNYNFIQKLSMTINKALGIEPQSVKDELNIPSDGEQEFIQGSGSNRVISPRVTGLLESQDTDDEDEERNNKRKRLSYQRVGYKEPDLKAPEPVKLDDETQAYKDLYDERNRFDNSTSETNSALLRRAEEEIEKQSEAVKELNDQETLSPQSETSQDIESIYYIELMKERARLEQALEDERESNRLAIRKSEDNIQQQLLDLILNAQNTDLDSRSNDPINQLVQALVSEDKNKNSEQLVIDATRIVQMIQNQITESNGSSIDEFLLRKRIEDELKSEFVYMQREQEKKMKLVYRKMLEDMYMDMINS